MGALLTLEMNLSLATSSAGSPIRVVSMAQRIPIPRTIPISRNPRVLEIERARKATAVVSAPVMIPEPERRKVCSMAEGGSGSMARRSL